MTKGIFITATGTDVGKTYISALILKKMNGLNCKYYKPCMSGIEPDKLSDVEYVFKVAGLEGNPMDYVSYPFKEALSPHLAACRSKQTIKLEKIKSDFEKIKSQSDYILIEGAGGITCPFDIQDNSVLLLPDVVKELGLDIIIVADAALGTINSTLLTVNYAKSLNIGIQGIILNRYDKANFMHIDNKKQIERLCKVKVISTVQENSMDIDDLSMYFKEI